MYQSAVEECKKQFVGSVYIKREGGEKEPPPAPHHGVLTLGNWTMALWNACEIENLNNHDQSN